MSARQGLHRPEIDGLRFLGFLLVFVHHVPGGAWSPFVTTVHEYGWVGVELFFVLSSFLFFWLLRAEHDATGRIAVSKFYQRRFLRIYPLMGGYALFMVVAYAPMESMAWTRLLALLLGLDNMATWLQGYNVAVPFSPHLWTLSFELQVYLFIPVAFLVLRALGDRRFLLLLLTLWVYSTAARGVTVWLGADHPKAWVTPLLRPDTVLAGMALSVYRPTWHPLLSALVALIGGMALISFPTIAVSPWGTMLGYPAAAMMCVGLLDFVMRWELARAVFIWSPVRFLGTISFGLYVYHWWAIHKAAELVPLVADDFYHYARFFVVALSITVALAFVSYYAYERIFLHVKSRLSVVEGRPI